MSCKRSLINVYDFALKACYLRRQNIMTRPVRMNLQLLTTSDCAGDSGRCGSQKDCPAESLLM